MRTAVAPAVLISALTTAGVAKAEDGCAGHVETDACLVGTWRMESGGAVEWMRNNVPDGVKLPPIAEKGGGGIVRYRSDGTYAGRKTGNEDGTNDAAFDGPSTFLGRWAADGNTLYQCSDKTAFDATMEVGGKRMTLQLPDAGPQSFDYRCEGDKLQTSRAFPGMPEPMVTHYVRVAE